MSDPGAEIRIGKFMTLDKHPESATLFKRKQSK
jgi:hypothetical protein